MCGQLCPSPFLLHYRADSRYDLLYIITKQALMTNTICRFNQNRELKLNQLCSGTPGEGDF